MDWRRSISGLLSFVLLDGPRNWHSDRVHHHYEFIPARGGHGQTPDDAPAQNHQIPDRTLNLPTHKYEMLELHICPIFTGIFEGFFRFQPQKSTKIPFQDKPFGSQFGCKLEFLTFDGRLPHLHTSDLERVSLPQNPPRRARRNLNKISNCQERRCLRPCF